MIGPALTLLAFGFGGVMSLESRLDAILDRPILKGAVVCVSVRDEKGADIYARNADLRAMPASNQKLLSNAFALHVLGPHWKPTTRFWKKDGRLVIDCPGDPSMTYARLKGVSEKLAFQGPVYARQGYRQGVPPTWENDDLPHRYAPRITALTLERGAFTLANHNGVPMLVPESFGVRLLHFAGGPIRTEFDPFGNVMVLRGDLPKEAKNLENFAIPEPDRAAASILGGPLFETNSLPADRPDLTVEGDAIGKMAKDCLVPSDNYLGECLMMLAASHSGPLGENPYAVAPNRMRDFLVNAVGLSRDEVRPMDGSGMSRHNLVTARGIAKLLAWSARQPWASLWMDALARPGVGTLSNRLAGSSFVGKTGSLNSVIALSGYVRTARGERWVVSVLLNHVIGSAAEARQAADDFVRELEKPAEFTSIPVTIGSNFGGRMAYAGNHALPQHWPIDGHWFP